MSDAKNSLESWVVGKLSSVGSVKRPMPRRTRGSGCGNEIGDVSNDFCYVECKMKHTKENIIVDFKEEWNHLLFRIPIHSNKFPLVIVENKFGEKFAVLKAEDFFEILVKAEHCPEDDI